VLPTSRLAGLFFSPWLYRGLRWALGAVFLYAGLVKLLDPSGFAGIIARYGLLPEPLLPWAALGLPALEVLAGVGLTLDVKGSLSLLTALLLLFAAVLWWGVLAGLDIDCGCFSTSELAEHDALRSSLYRDLMMLAAAAYLYLWRLECHLGRVACGWRYAYSKTRKEVH